MKHNSFLLYNENNNKTRKHNFTCLIRDYNKYTKSPNSRILLSSSPLFSEALRNYKDIVYYHTLNDSKTENFDFNNSISIRPFSSKKFKSKNLLFPTVNSKSKRTFPYNVCNLKGGKLPCVKRPVGLKRNSKMILCSNNIKKELESETNNRQSTRENSKSLNCFTSAGFTNQTLSSIFKIDHTLFNLKPKIKQEMGKTFINLIQKKKKKSIIENEEKKDGKEIVIDQLLNLFDNVNKYGTGTKNCENYVKKLDLEIKKNIKKNEYKVKDTLDNLRRLQRDNDDNLNRVSFIKKIVFK